MFQLYSFLMFVLHTHTHTHTHNMSLAIRSSWPVKNRQLGKQLGKLLQVLCQNSSVEGGGTEEGVVCVTWLLGSLLSRLYNTNHL